MRTDQEKIKSITINILKGLSEFADEIIGPLTFSGLKRNLYYMEGDPRRLTNNIKSLERRGYLKINYKSDSVVLTNKGRIKLIESSTDNRIDGKWRMLSFDIPEQMSKKRDQLRRSIKRIGYRQVQKSLWACPFSRADQIDLIIKELELKQYTAYFLVERTDIEKHLKRLFRIKL